MRRGLFLKCFYKTHPVFYIILYINTIQNDFIKEKEYEAFETRCGRNS